MVGSGWPLKLCDHFNPMLPIEILMGSGKLNPVLIEKLRVVVRLSVVILGSRYTP